MLESMQTGRRPTISLNHRGVRVCIKGAWSYAHRQKAMQAIVCETSEVDTFELSENVLFRATKIRAS